MDYEVEMQSIDGDQNWHERRFVVVYKDLRSLYLNNYDTVVWLIGEDQ